MTSRGSLQEFQQQLAQRLRGASNVSPALQRIGVQAGEHQWLIRLQDTGAVMPVSEISSVPLTRPWFLGLANIRGNLASVIDFGAFMGKGPTVRTPECRLVLIAEHFGVHCGLLVARIMGLQNLEQLHVGEGGDERAWVGTLYRDRNGSSWFELKIDALVAHDDFLRVGL